MPSLSKQTILVRGVDVDLWKAFREKAVNENGGDLWASIGPALNRALSNYLKQIGTHAPLQRISNGNVAMDKVKAKILDTYPLGTYINRKVIESTIMAVEGVSDYRALKRRIERLQAEKFIEINWDKVDGSSFRILGDLERHIPSATQI